jgi:hypothetical protein
MPVIRTGESEYDKEFEKWNTPKRLGGYGPDGHEEFPLMLSKAQKLQNGQYAVHQMPPPRWHYDAGVLGDAQWDQAVRMAGEFTLRCQMTVRNRQEYDRAVAQGWVRGQEEALQRAEAFEIEMGNEAAARAYRDRTMSDAAQREAQAAEQAMVPETPIRRGPGRPRNADAADAHA